MNLNNGMYVDRNGNVQHYEVASMAMPRLAAPPLTKEEKQRVAQEAVSRRRRVEDIMARRAQAEAEAYFS